MGINFPDLQVLLPRTDELARAASPGQQHDVNQMALAQAAEARAERERNRVSKLRKTERTARTRKEEPGSGRPARRGFEGKGRRIDIDA